MKIRFLTATFLCSSIVTIQLLCLVFVNTYQLVDGYYVTNNRKEECKNDKFLQAGNKILTSGLYKLYTNYTGTNSGYGFYGPNVGSEFILSFTVLDSDNKVLGKHRRPSTIIQNESKQRFDLCTYPMMLRIEQENKNKILDDYFEVLLHQISEKINNEYDSGYKVIAEIFLHDFPDIENSSKGEQEGFKILERYKFTF